MSDARGFSLVETLCAIGLVTGVLVALTQLLADGVRATAAARHLTVATLLAQNKLEQLRGVGTLSDVVAATEHFDGSGLQVCSGAEVCEAAMFTVHWSIASLPSAPGTVLIQVGVSHAHRSHGQVRSFAIRPRSVR